MTDLGKVLVFVGLGIAGLGVLLWLSGRVPWLGHLPGDIDVQRPGFRFYFPLTTGLLLSLLLSLLFWWLRKR